MARLKIVFYVVVNKSLCALGSISALGSYIEVLQVAPAGPHLHFGLQLYVQFDGRLHLPLDDLGDLMKDRRSQRRARAFIVTTGVPG